MCAFFEATIFYLCFFVFPAVTRRLEQFSHFIAHKDTYNFKSAGDAISGKSLSKFVGVLFTQQQPNPSVQVCLGRLPFGNYDYGHFKARDFHK